MLLLIAGRYVARGGGERLVKRSGDASAASDERLLPKTPGGCGGAVDVGITGDGDERGLRMAEVRFISLGTRS
jgi:hypothetical protein